MYKIEVDPDGDYHIYLNGVQILNEIDIYKAVEDLNVQQLMEVLCNTLNGENNRQPLTLSGSLVAKESRNIKWFEAVTARKAYIVTSNDHHQWDDDDDYLNMLDIVGGFPDSFR